MFEARITEANNNVKSFSTLVGETWYRTIENPDVMELWDKDPKTMSYWIRNAESVTVRVGFKLENSDSMGTLALACEFSRALPMHNDFSMYGPKNPKLEAHFVPGLTEAIHALRKIEREREELKEKIKQLLETCGSLQQAYKVFPSILELCPEDYVERFNRPVEKKEKTEIALDPTFVTSLTKARMLKDVTSNQSSTS
jgi:hypothetical protein